MSAVAGPKLSSITQIRALYRGILGPLASAGVFQALNFGIYDNCRNVAQLGPFESAAIAGGLLSIFNTPVGLVKVQEQVLPVDKRSSTMGRLQSLLRGPKPIRVCWSSGACALHVLLACPRAPLLCRAAKSPTHSVETGFSANYRS